MNSFLDRIRSIASDPSADTTMTAVFIAILVLSLALLGAIGYLFYSHSNKDRVQVQVEIPVTENTFELWLQRVIIAVVLISFFALSGRYIENPAFCAKCHNTNTEAKALIKTVHNKLACLQCHQQPGFTGAILQKIDYARWVAIYVKTDKAEPKHAVVKNDACISCHSKILSKTYVTHSIRVRHKDFIKKGARCVDCHNSVAHPGVVKPEQSPSMTSCVSCHNGQTASAKCSVCHTKDIGDRMRLPKRDRLKVGVSVKWNFCYRCHENKKCTSCHGVTMPHPPDWVSGVKHARPAFVNIKTCWRCHDMPNEPLKPAPLIACACHGVVNQYHEPEPVWIKNHGPIALGKLSGDGMNERCYSCHGKKLCDFCHVTGKYKAIERKTETDTPEISSSVSNIRIENTSTPDSTSTAVKQLENNATNSSVMKLKASERR
ncbi:MAG: NapC/NirT family cytochrome c [Rubrobacteridae bacterium]|nr:NapC/NirT family cytochrome c [Rubrobacteridae bacterium]